MSAVSMANWKMHPLPLIPAGIDRASVSCLRPMLIRVAMMSLAKRSEQFRNGATIASELSAKCA